MTDELPEIVATNRLRLLMYREILARLLAYVARREPDPEAVLRNFFEAGDQRIEGFVPKTAFEFRANEVLQRDKDWIVALARQLME